MAKSENGPVMAESVFSHRGELYSFVRQGVLSEAVLKKLLPDGEPLEYERQLWDYKLELPCLPLDRNPIQSEVDAFNGSIAEIVKDCTAFYNSYGGFVLAGIRDAPRELVGYQGHFDCDALNKRIQAATGQAIECYYKTFETTTDSGSLVRLGLLFIPQRPDAILPAQFLKDAPPKPGGKRAYAQKDIYFRTGDQCCRTESSEHYAFLCTPGRRSLAEPSYNALASPVLDSNLGARDESFIEFVGREAYLASLWSWFFDKFSAVRLLAGVGGVGKTTLAREFSEQVARAAPFGFQKVIWLSAKRQTYTAISGRYVAASRVDFENVDGLLRQICLELAYTTDEVPEDASRDALLDATVRALTVMPALVVVDDVDSLEPEQQQDMFHALIASFSQTVRGSQVGSRALLTARLDLGAAPGQVIRVKGLEQEEFLEFVRISCTALDLPESTVNAIEKRLPRFLKISEGSPTFASSILRLIALGENIDKAMMKWEKSDGEEVRRFAFERELEQLTDAARAVLYALCVLGESTLIELSVVLTRSEQQVRDNLAELRRYHLVAHGDEHLPGGNQIAAPGTLRMMRPILREKVREPNRIESGCARARSAAPRTGRDLRPQINRIAALWANGQAREAHEIAEILERQHPDDPDIKYVVGRANLRLPKPDLRRAELAFRKAQEMGCHRAELLTLWVETKAALGDWNGLLEITGFKGQEVPPADLLLARADAHRKLIDMERAVGNVRSAAERALEAGREIDRAFRLRRAAGAVQELKQFRRDFLSEYVSLVDQATPNPGDHIDVWLAVLNSFDCFVRSSRLLRLGALRLESWWGSAEGRGERLARTEKSLGTQLGRLRQIIDVLKRQEYPDEALYNFLASKLNDLENRRAKYLDELDA